MDRKKLENLRKEVASFRHSQAKSKELQGLAERMGLRRVNRGKEPTFVSDEIKSFQPLTVPGHKGRDLTPGVKNSILNHMEGVLDAWEERIVEHERGSGSGTKNGGG
jgi:hypothetical protein